MFSIIFVCLQMLLLFEDSSTLSIANVYTRYIKKQGIDQADTFGFHVQKPIAYKGDEPIWPRSYGYSAEMFFDENGAAFPVRPRKKLGSIIRPLQISVQHYDDDNDKNEERRALREFYKRLKAARS